MQIAVVLSTITVRGMSATKAFKAAKLERGSVLGQVWRLQWAGLPQGLSWLPWIPSSGGTGPTRWNSINTGTNSAASKVIQSAPMFVRRFQHDPEICLLFSCPFPRPALV